MSEVLVVVGMEAEARIARRAFGSLARLAVGASAAAQAEDEGAVGVLSFGICGALDPDLSPGDVVVGRTVLSPHMARPCHQRWSEALLRRLPGAVPAAVLGAEAPAVSPEEKERLREDSGAAVVDLESGPAAAAAARHGLPLAVLRIVADPAERAIPRAALAGLRPDGATDAGAVLRALARRPGDLPGLLRLALETGVALRSLGRVAPRLRRVLAPPV